MIELSAPYCVLITLCSNSTSAQLPRRKYSLTYCPSFSSPNEARRASAAAHAQNACRLQASKDAFPHTTPASPRLRKRKLKCQVGIHVEGESDGPPVDEDVSLPEDDDSARAYVDFNDGQWSGIFTRYDFAGNVMHKVATQLAVVAREDESGAPGLQQTLKIQQANNNGWKEEKPEVFYKAAMDRKMQLGVFKEQHALALQHQSAEMLDKVLRVGVLGEEAQGDEFPEGVKLPSRRPALVAESCLYAADRGRRIRAFHVLDPRGLIDTIGIFDEIRFSSDGASTALENEVLGNVDGDRLERLLGSWHGLGVVNRSGLYGGTSSEQVSNVNYRLEADGSLVQELCMKIGGQSRTMASKGKVNGCLISFDNFQMTLLPGGITMSSPTLVARGQAFYFETGLMERDGTRRRLVRTYDPEGMVVSTTLYTETKQS